MFASNKGNTILPVNSSSDFGPIYWVASKTDSQYYLKLANYGSEEVNVTAIIPNTTNGRLEMLAGSRLQANLPYDVTLQTVTTEVNDVQGNYTVTMPPWAVAVLAMT